MSKKLILHAVVVVELSGAVCSHAQRAFYSCNVGRCGVTVWASGWRHVELREREEEAPMDKCYHANGPAVACLGR